VIVLLYGVGHAPLRQIEILGLELAHGFAASGRKALLHQTQQPGIHIPALFERADPS